MCIKCTDAGLCRFCTNALLIRLSVLTDEEWEDPAAVDLAANPPPRKPVVILSGPAWRRRVKREAARDPKVLARFWAKVDKSAGTEGCWLWTGTKLKTGYGMFTVRRFVNASAHRFSYLVAHKRINSKLIIRHRCDNPRCVNPAHLEQGTHEDNARDMVERGRFNKGQRKLTDEQVREGRRLYATKIMTQKELAQRYNVGTWVMSMMLRGETYCDVLDHSDPAPVCVQGKEVPAVSRPRARACRPTSCTPCL